LVRVRAGGTVVTQGTASPDALKTSSSAAALYVGAKAALSTANGIRPAIAVIPQATIDTRPGPGVDRLLPGVNVDASWEIRKDRDNIEAVVASNRVAPPDGRSHVEIAAGITNAILFHDRFEAFTEWTCTSPRRSPSPRGSTSWAASSCSRRTTSRWTFVSEQV
jgi:hypothetical protein